MNNYSNEQALIVLGLVATSVILTPWCLAALAFMPPHGE